MHRNVSNALKRWSSKTSAHKGEEIAHLCRSCQKLVITQNMLKGIPESSLPDGSLALDLQQGYIDLPMKKGDRSPGFDCLKEAALSRCEFCVSLLDAIHQTRITRKVAWERLDQAGDIVVKFRYCFGPDPGIGTFEAGQWPFMLAALEALIQPKNAAPGDPGIVIAFKIHCEPESKAGKYLRIRRRMVNDVALSYDNRVKIKEWIHECRENHFACSPMANSWIPARPTRLLYVGDRSRDILPRLVLDNQLRAETRYTALSYCWGPPSSMRLTTTPETLRDRFQGISWSAVPRTFSDACLAAKVLGFDYVWIDALCIVQNDTKDWQIEAAKMGDIYRGAQLTMVAASAKSTNDGFLERAMTRYGVLVPYQSPIHGDIRGSYCLTYSEQGYKEEFQEDVENSTWNERGWTFQERQLSRRVLFFGKHRVHFECREHWRSEDYERPIHRKLALYKQMQNTEQWAVLSMSWRKIIEEFSARKFTFLDDRLPALAGLARDIMSKPHSENDMPRDYIAGHWVDSLVDDLTWLPVAADGVEEPGSPVPRSRPVSRSQVSFRSPTWSWCTSLCKVVWLRYDMEGDGVYGYTSSLCEIERSSTRLTSSDMFGAIQGGFLDMYGAIAEVKKPQRRVISKHWYTIFEDGYFLEAATYHSKVTPTAFWEQSAVNPNGDNDHADRITVLQYAFDEDQEAVSVPNALYVPRPDSKAIHTCWLALTSAYHGSRYQWYQGLILLPIGSTIMLSKNDVASMDQPFRRIGVFRSHRIGWGWKGESEQFERRFGFNRCRYRVV